MLENDIKLGGLEGADLRRRRFLTAATAGVGLAGMGIAMVPFGTAMKPSARTQAAGAPVELALDKLQPGQRVMVEWRGRPVWVVYRTEKMLAALAKREGELRDPGSNESKQPAYAKSVHRSIKPEYLVVLGLCTHLGCSPVYRPELAPADLGPDWLGGFFCPCHGSAFDLSGRVFKGVPAPTNLEVPPHMYRADGILVIGQDEESA